MSNNGPKPHVLPTQLGKTFEFTVKDRITIGSFLPEKGDLPNLIVSRMLANKVRVGKVEGEAIGLKSMMAPGGGGSMLAWDDSKAVTVTVKLTQPELMLLQSSIEDLQKKKELSSDQLDTALKILGMDAVPIEE